MSDEQREQDQAFLVGEVGFTPEQADDCTSGDIDRNGAAAMLPGIIEALGERIEWSCVSEDDIVEYGVRILDNENLGQVQQWVFTALKLLARARKAEARARDREELGRAAANGAAAWEEQAIALRARLEALGHPVNTDIAGRWWPPTGSLIDPTVAALAVVDDLEASGVVKIVPVDLAERLAKVIGSVARRDIKPHNPFPQWCAFETDPRSETAFHGPRDTKALAEVEAEALRADGHAADVRRCRRVTVTDDLVRWVAEQLVEHVNEDTSVLADVDGATCYGDWESEIASLREALDARVEIKLWLIEPEGVTP